MHRYMLIITELWSEVPETSQERKKLHAIEWLSHHKSMMLWGGGGSLPELYQLECSFRTERPNVVNFS